MKQISLILLLLLSTLAFSSCKDDDEQSTLQVSDLPQNSQEFLTRYFPGHEILSISYDLPALSKSTGQSPAEENTYLYVLLNDDIYVSFLASNGEWAVISAPNGLPSTATPLIDDHVYQKLMKKEGQAKITSLRVFYSHSILIGLDNQNTYAQTQLLVYSGTTLAETRIEENILNKISNFLKRNKLAFSPESGRIFKLTEEEGIAYRLFIGEKLILSFNENGDWIHGAIPDIAADLKAAETALGKIAENEIPQSVMESIRQVSELGSIRIIASYGNGNYGFRFTGKDLLINEKTGIFTPIQAANKLLSAYYDSASYSLLYPNGITLVGAYEYTTTFIYKSETNDVSIEMDMNGNWLHIESYSIANDKVTYLPLPAAIVKELPAPIIEYLNSHYKDKEIYTLFHRKGGYQIHVDKIDLLYFNENGSFQVKGTIIQMS